KAELEVLDLRRRDMIEHLQAVLDNEGYADSVATELLDVRRGAPAHVLVEAAEELDASLIVLGPHRRRGLLDFGGTARGVLAHAPCDLWMQPGEFRTPAS